MTTFGHREQYRRFFDPDHYIWTKKHAPHLLQMSYLDSMFNAMARQNDLGIKNDNWQPPTANNGAISFVYDNTSIICNIKLDDAKKITTYELPMLDFVMTMNDHHRKFTQNELFVMFPRIIEFFSNKFHEQYKMAVKCDYKNGKLVIGAETIPSSMGYMIHFSYCQRQPFINWIVMPGPFGNTTYLDHASVPNDDDDDDHNNNKNNDDISTTSSAPRKMHSFLDDYNAALSRLSTVRKSFMQLFIPDIQFQFDQRLRRDGFSPGMHIPSTTADDALSSCLHAYFNEPDA
jgi:hypothetical protein